MNQLQINDEPPPHYQRGQQVLDVPAPQAQPNNNPLNNNPLNNNPPNNNPPKQRMVLRNVGLTYNGYASSNCCLICCNYDVVCSGGLCTVCHCSPIRCELCKFRVIAMLFIPVCCVPVECKNCSYCYPECDCLY